MGGVDVYVLSTSTGFVVLTLKYRANFSRSAFLL